MLLQGRRHYQVLPSRRPEYRVSWSILVALHSLQAFLTQSVTEILNLSLRALAVRVSDNGDSVVRDCLLSPAKAALMEMPLTVFGPFSLASKRASFARPLQTLQQLV